MVSTKASILAKELDKQSHFGGENFGNYHYVFDSEGLAVELPERFPGRLFPLDYALGSGEHAVTFLTLLKDGQETISVEHRLTWFRHLNRLSITPGQTDDAPEREMECFGKVFRGKDMHRCVRCHVTTGQVVNARVENLTPAIHCERCHGPGKRHVESAEKGTTADISSTIRHGWSPAEEVAMCGECHRMPDEIEPERLKRYPDSLVRFQPVGLLQSKCYLASEGALGCTSCHEPHDGVHSRTVEVQTETCRSCHSTGEQTRCGISKADGCIDCHMPAIELLPGIAFHDHWIRVREDQSPANGTAGDAHEAPKR